MNKSILIALVATLLAAPAYAQDTLDAHGFQPIATDGDLLDPISLYRGEAHEQHSVGAQGLFEYAREPLILYRMVDGATSSDVLLRDISAVNLSVFYAPHERVSLGVSAPLYLSVDGQGTQDGLGMGDLRLSGSVGLILPKENEVSFGLSLAPNLTAPGFYGDSMLSSNGVSGGGVAALSVSDETWDVTVNAGFELTPDIEFYNIDGGERLLTGIAAGVVLTEDIALRTEATLRPDLSSNDYAWTNTPSEIGASLRGYSGDNFGWTAGVSHALSRGISAADWRVFAGLNLAFGSRYSDPVFIPPCEECGYADIVLVSHTPDGDPVDLPVVITNYVDGVTTTTNNGNVINLPPGEYLVSVTVPPCETLTVIEGDEIILLEPIQFDFDKSTIRFPDSQAVMSDLVEILLEHQEITRLQVATSTDTRGSDSYNMELSTRRAESVVRFLVDHGVDESRLTWVGYGETMLLNDNCTTEECHESNRYAQFKILEVR